MKGGIAGLCRYFAEKLSQVVTGLEESSLGAMLVGLMEPFDTIEKWINEHGQLHCKSPMNMGASICGIGFTAKPVVCAIGQFGPQT
jgi:hypothetical protein